MQKHHAPRFRQQGESEHHVPGSLYPLEVPPVSGTPLCKHISPRSGVRAKRWDGEVETKTKDEKKDVIPTKKHQQLGKELNCENAALAVQLYAMFLLLTPAGDNYPPRVPSDTRKSGVMYTAIKSTLNDYGKRVRLRSLRVRRLELDHFIYFMLQNKRIRRRIFTTRSCALKGEVRPPDISGITTQTEYGRFLPGP